MSTSVTKRVFLGVLCGSIAVGSLAMPSKAHAAFPVLVTADIQAGIKAIGDALAWTAAKTVVQSITQSTVNWINGGFEGSPAYVTDIGNNLGRLADTVADDFIRDLDTVARDNTGISIRAPFQDQIAAQLREEFYRTSSSYGFNVRNPYTLGGYSNDPAAFNRGDFRQGGFNAWFEQIKPENNPYGRYMLARGELFRQIDNEAENRIRELNWGNGFLSWRGSCGPNGIAPRAPLSFENQGPIAGAGAPVNLNQRDTTRGCSIRTPGAIIEDQLANTLGSNIRQLELADSVNEIVSALASQLVSQVLGGSGLSGVNQPSSGGGSSYLDRATSPSQYAGQLTSLANGLSQEVTRQQRDSESYRANWQRIQSAASSAQQRCRNGSNASEARRVLEQANTNVARANAAITALAGVQTRIGEARANISSSGGTSISAVVSEYQSLISGDVGSIAGEVDQSRIDASDTGSQEPGSLYSQMVRLAARCR